MKEMLENEDFDDILDEETLEIVSVENVSENNNEENEG